MTTLNRKQSWMPTHQNRCCGPITCLHGVNKLIREQKQDPTLQSARQEGGESTSYVYQDGVLYRHSTDQLQNDVLQLLLPQARRNTAIQVAHTVPMVGTWGSNALCTAYSNTSTRPHSLEMSGRHANHAHNVRRL